MPKQVPKSITGFGGGAYNLARVEPECMAQIAVIALRWTEIEGHLVQLVNGALSTVERQNGGALGLSGNRIARVALEQAETIRTRIKLINALLGPLLEGHPLQDKWAKIRDDLEKQSKMRNQIVHGDWSHAAELPGKLVRKIGRNRESWSVEDFESVGRRNHQLVMNITSLTVEIASAKLRGEILQPQDQMNSMAIAVMGTPPS